jgi:uncharacterized membrane protein YhiD involved in acid resistance
MGERWRKKCSSAVVTGASLVPESALLTLFVIAGNTVLRPLVNRINPIPFDEETSQAAYEGSHIHEAEGRRRGARCANRGARKGALSDQRRRVQRTPASDFIGHHIAYDEKATQETSKRGDAFMAAHMR